MTPIQQLSDGVLGATVLTEHVDADEHAVVAHGKPAGRPQTVDRVPDDALDPAL